MTDTGSFDDETYRWWWRTDCPAVWVWNKTDPQWYKMDIYTRWQRIVKANGLNNTYHSEAEADVQLEF